LITVNQKNKNKENNMETKIVSSVQPVCSIVHEKIVNSKKELVKTIESYSNQILPMENVEIVATCKGLEIISLNFIFNLEKEKDKKIIVKLNENFAKTLCQYENRDGGGLCTRGEKSKRPKEKAINFDQEDDQRDIFAEEFYSRNRVYRKTKNCASYNYSYEFFKNNHEIKDNIINFMSCKLENPDQTNLTIDTSSLPDEQPKKNFPIAYAVGILVLITAIALGILNYSQKK
jgi:hypothetical protein